MRKQIIIFIFLAILFSCNKKKSEVIITQQNVPAKTEESKTDSDITEEESHLINITAQDELAILVRADSAPEMYFDEDGKLTGYYVELEEAVMKKMGQKYKLIPYTDVGPVIQRLKAGELHSAIAAPDVPDFRALFNFSIVYEVSNQVIFLHNTSNEIIPENREEAIKSLYGKKVGVQTRGHFYQLFRTHKEIEIVEYPTTTAALEALSKGEVDAVPDVKRVGAYNARLNNWDIKPVGGAVHSLGVGTVFSKALDTSVIDRYNKALNTLIESGFVKELNIKYFGE